MDISEKRDGFIGFTFNGHHSSEYNIVRVSDSSRYNENLTPAFSDKTTQVTGRDGLYYFGSDYTQAQINISFAFDSVTEENLLALHKWFNVKTLEPLYLDEDCTFSDAGAITDGKYYLAKVSAQPNIKYLCFDNGDGERVYKGEGSVSFVAFYPFKLRDKTTTYFGTNDTAPMSNEGQQETDWIIEIPFSSMGKIAAGSIYLNTDDNINVLTLNELTKEGSDASIVINSKTNTIEGRTSTGALGSIYNKYIDSGHFFKIPVSTTKLYCTVGTGVSNRSLIYKEIYY